MKRIWRLTCGELFKLSRKRWICGLAAALLLCSALLPLLSGNMSHADAPGEAAANDRMKFERLEREFDRTYLTPVQNQIADLYVQTLREMLELYGDRGISPNYIVYLSAQESYAVSWGYSYLFSKRVQELGQQELGEIEIDDLTRRFPFYYFPYLTWESGANTQWNSASAVWDKIERGIDPDENSLLAIEHCSSQIQAAQNSGDTDYYHILQQELKRLEYSRQAGGCDPADWKFEACQTRNALVQQKFFYENLIARFEEDDPLYLDLAAHEAEYRAQYDQFLRQAAKQIPLLESAIARDQPPIDYPPAEQATRRHLLDFLPLLLPAAALLGAVSALVIGQEYGGQIEGLLCRRTGRTKILLSKLLACALAAAGLVLGCALLSFVTSALCFGAADLFRSVGWTVGQRVLMVPFPLWFAGRVLSLLCAVWLSMGAAFLVSMYSRRTASGVAVGVAIPLCAAVGMMGMTVSNEYQRYRLLMAASSGNSGWFLSPPHISFDLLYTKTAQKMQLNGMIFVIIALLIPLIVLTVHIFHKQHMDK